MPTYFPKGRSNRHFPEKMTFRGQGVESLLEIIDMFVPDEASNLVMDTAQGKEVFDFVTGEDFNEIRTPMYEYFPDHQVKSKFPAKITLRGPEVDALKEVFELLNGTKLSPEAEFLRDFVQNRMGSEKLHMNPPRFDQEVSDAESEEFAEQPA